MGRASDLHERVRVRGRVGAADLVAPATDGERNPPPQGRGGGPAPHHMAAFAAVSGEPGPPGHRPAAAAPAGFDAPPSARHVRRSAPWRSVLPPPWAGRGGRVRLAGTRSTLPLGSPAGRGEITVDARPSTVATPRYLPSQRRAHSTMVAEELVEASPGRQLALPARACRARASTPTRVRLRRGGRVRAHAGGTAGGSRLSTSHVDDLWA